MFRTGVRAVVAGLGAGLLAVGLPIAGRADFNHRFPGKGSEAAWHKSWDWSQQAVAAQDRGDHRTAESLFRKAISTYPYDALSYFNLGLFLNEQQRYSESEPVLRRSVSLQPVFQNWDELGISLALQGHYKESRSAFLEAAKFARSESEKQALKQHEQRLRELMQKGARS